jgi:hypothetical protein
MGCRMVSVTMTRILDSVVGLPATRHGCVALKRQHQGEQQRESHAKGSVQSHFGSKHTTAPGIIHLAGTGLAVRSTE